MRIILLVIILILYSSCTKDSTENEYIIENIICELELDSLIGVYDYSSSVEDSPHPITFIKDSISGFQTLGILGLWYPKTALSGDIIGCEISINSYNNVKYEGLPTPGGYPRYYYDSMSGQGRYFPENDSIQLYIDFLRTGDFGETSFKGNLYLKKRD